MRALIGLDIGTSAVKALAVSEDDGAILARCEVGLPALHAAARLGRAGSRRTGGARPRRCSRPLARRRGSAGIGLSGQMHGLVALDAAGEVDPPRDPLERRPDGRGVRRDRGARRARAADRADRQPRADRLHGAQAAVAAQARARRTTRGSRGSCCRRTTCGCGCAASTRSTWPTRPGTLLLDVARPALERRGARRARARPARGCRGCSSRPRCRARRPTACRSPRARATRRRARSASASTGRGRSRSRSGPPASCSPRCPRSPPTPRRACTRSATRCRAAGTRWA